MAGLTEIMLIIAGLVLLVGVLYLIPAIGKYLAKVAKWLGSFQTIIGIIAIIVAIIDLASGANIIEAIWLILSGLILAAGILPAIPALGKILAKVSKALAGVQVPIGIIALILAFI